MMLYIFHIYKKIPIYFVLISSTLWIISCAPPPPTVVQNEASESTRTYTVDLPKPIDLEALIPPLRHADQSYRIDGLLMRSHQYLDKEITVKGYIVDKPKCRSREGDICAKPHLWLADALGQSTERLRVVGMKRKKMKRFKLNKAYKITGKLVQSHSDGFASSQGLLVYKSFEKVK